MGLPGALAKDPNHLKALSGLRTTLISDASLTMPLMTWFAPQTGSPTGRVQADEESLKAWLPTSLCQASVGLETKLKISQKKKFPKGPSSTA